MKRVALLVTGTRSPSEKCRAEVCFWLEQFDRPGVIAVTLLHGNCSGADTAADVYGRKKKWDVFPVSFFEDMGAAGGPARNRCLVDLLAVLQKHGAVCRVGAFPDDESVGTYRCIEYAQESGFQPKVIHLGARSR